MIMMIYKKGDSGQPEHLGDVKLSGTIDKCKNFMSNLDSALRTFLEGTLGEPVLFSGLTYMRSCGDFWSSFRKREGAPYEVKSISGLSEGVISARESETLGDASIDWSRAQAVVTAGNELGAELIVGIDVYDTGYIISNSAMGTNMLGGSYRLYFKNITKTKFMQNSRAYARVFKDEKAVLKYLSDHKGTFSYMVSKYGYEFGIEKASSLWEHTPKADVISAIKNLLEEINGSEPEVKEVNVKENAFDEAVSRMKEMDLYKPVIDDFVRDNKLYMSEFGGILYDLNEEAERAVREAERYGLPYHVVRNQSSLGDMYAVLYVSKYQDEWEMEHLDPRTGLVLAYVYNATYTDDSELGSIGIKTANGGLMRVA